MSLFDELKQEAAKRSPLLEKQHQIETLRKNAQAAFNAQFLLDAQNVEKIVFLKGKIAAFDECLKLFASEEESKQRTGRDDEE